MFCPLDRPKALLVIAASGRPCCTVTNTGAVALVKTDTSLSASHRFRGNIAGLQLQGLFCCIWSSSCLQSGVELQLSAVHRKSGESQQMSLRVEG